MREFNMRPISWSLNPWSMFSMWKGKLKVNIWLLEWWPLKPRESAMFTLLNSLNLQGRHLNKWMKEETRDYVLNVLESTVRGISVVRKCILYRL